MIRIRRGPAAGLLILGCAAVVSASAVVPAGAAASQVSAAAAAGAICTSATHPGLAARISRGIAAALASRTDSVVGLAAADTAEGLACKLHQTVHFYAASVIKVTIISALLLKKGGPSHLTKAQHDLAYLMITQSNNDAAQDLWQQVGLKHMQVFLNRAHMTHTVLNDAWGLTLITAQDELTLLRLLTAKGAVLSNSSRGYVLWLMSKVISSERWGVPAGAPADVTVHVKNGWLPYPKADDWHINSIGAFTGKGIDYQIVVLTGPPAAGGQGEAYGIDTVQAAARVINRELAGKHADTAAPVQPPGPAALTASGG